jgi:hypothetical protein
METSENNPDITPGRVGCFSGPYLVGGTPLRRRPFDENKIKGSRVWGKGETDASETLSSLTLSKYCLRRGCQEKKMRIDEGCQEKNDEKLTSFDRRRGLERPP